MKKTRASLKTGDLREELIIDHACYEKHPDCDTLVWFVYDPEGGSATRPNLNGISRTTGNPEGSRDHRAEDERLEVMRFARMRRGRSSQRSA